MFGSLRSMGTTFAKTFSQLSFKGEGFPGAQGHLVGKHTQLGTPGTGTGEGSPCPLGCAFLAHQPHSSLSVQTGSLCSDKSLFVNVPPKSNLHQRLMSHFGYSFQIHGRENLRGPSQVR